jgi:hypothetical protein
MKSLFSKSLLVLLITTSLFTNYASAQNTFVKTYNSGDMGYCVREANGVSYVAVGCTDFYYNFNWLNMSPIINTNIHAIKTMTDGTLLWEKVYSYPGYRSLATWMENTSDNGYIITGRINQDLVWPPDSNDIILTKTDTDGNIQWTKIYDTGKDELGYCVQQTSDGGYIVSGFHDSVPLSLEGTTFALLIKTDATGNVIWEKKYEFAVRDLDTGESFPWVVKQTSDAGYILIGTTAGSHAADLYVIRTDQTGNVSWAKSYEHDLTNFRFSVGLDIIENSGGDFIVAGSLDKDQTLNEYNYPYILKLNSSGTILNAKFFDSAPPEMFQSGFSSVEETPDNGYLFTGMGGYSNFGMLAQILKTNSNFDMEWSRTYSNDAIATVGTRSGRATTDGCYIFTGKRFNDGTILMKTDNLGLIPCKNPGTLLEIAPSIMEVDRFPLTFSGINTSDITLNTQILLTDTSTLCPVTPAILPIELLSFNAKRSDEETILLQWATASEINNDYFEIEKSYNGIEFHSIGIVKGAGNSSTTSSYSYEDKSGESHRLTYYRLAQIDYDRTKIYSATISFSLQSSGPTLISSEFTSQRESIELSISTNTRENISVMITDMLGKICYQTILAAEAGIQQHELSIGALNTGMYILSISDKTKRINRKILK